MDDERAVGLDDRLREGTGVGVFRGFEKAGWHLGGVALISGRDLGEADRFDGDPGFLGCVCEALAACEGCLDFLRGLSGGFFQRGGGLLPDQAGAGFGATLALPLGASNAGGGGMSLSWLLVASLMAFSTSPPYTMQKSRIDFFWMQVGSW